MPIHADQPDCTEVDAYITARVNAPGTRANGREGQGVDTKGTGPSIKTNLLERAIQGAGNLMASAGRFLGRVAKGFVAGGTDAAVGLYHVAAHPLRTGAALGQAIRHPVHTAQVAWGGARDLALAMAAGDPDALGRGLFELGGLLFGVTKLGALDKLTDAARVVDKTRDAAQGASVARLVPGALPAAEEAAVIRILRHIDAGTKPAGALAKKWGATFKNWGGDLPGTPGKASVYREYRVAPQAPTTGAGTRRIVVNKNTGEVFYTWTHYGDTGAPAFVQIR